MIMYELDLLKLEKKSFELLSCCVIVKFLNLSYLMKRRTATHMQTNH